MEHQVKGCRGCGLYMVCVAVGGEKGAVVRILDGRKTYVEIHPCDLGSRDRPIGTMWESMKQAEERIKTAHSFVRVPATCPMTHRARNGKKTGQSVKVFPGQSEWHFVHEWREGGLELAAGDEVYVGFEKNDTYRTFGQSFLPLWKGTDVTWAYLRTGL